LSSSVRIAQALPLPSRLLPRILLAAGILIAEALVTSAFLDGDQLIARGGWLTGLLSRWGAWAVRFTLLSAVLFGASFIVDSISGLASNIHAAAGRFGARRSWIAHSGFLACFAALSHALYGATGRIAYPNLLTILWATAAAGVAASAVATVLPIRTWLPVFRQVRARLAGAAAAAIIACWLGALSEQLWEPARWATFRLVGSVLRTILPSLIVQPERFRIATGRFGVIIAPECS